MTLAVLPCHPLPSSFEAGSLPEPGTPGWQLVEQPASTSEPSVSVPSSMGPRPRWLAMWG